MLTYGFRGLRFSKKYFWFGDEAIPTKSLHSYLRGEKPDVAHHNAAWSSQTGRGLLYFSKQIEHKSTPGGIINLVSRSPRCWCWCWTRPSTTNLFVQAEASDLIKEGGLEFHFKLHGQKHSFQAASMSERDAWVAGMERAAAEAKATSSAIMAGSGYKEHMEKLGKLSSVLCQGKGGTNIFHRQARCCGNPIDCRQNGEHNSQEERGGTQERQHLR